MMITKNANIEPNSNMVKNSTSIYAMIEQTSVKYNRLLKQITEPLLHFGINYFCYQFVSKEGLWFTFGNNPSWMFHSAEQQFFQCDPSLANPNHYSVFQAFVFHKNIKMNCFNKL